MNFIDSWNILGLSLCLLFRFFCHFQVKNFCHSGGLTIFDFTIFSYHFRLFWLFKPYFSHVNPSLSPAFTLPFSHILNNFWTFHIIHFFRCITEQLLNFNNWKNVSWIVILRKNSWILGIFSDWVIQFCESNSTVELILSLVISTHG